MPPGAAQSDWKGLANAVWRYIVRPIAVGGMLVGAANTLWKMRKNLSIGLGRLLPKYAAWRPAVDSIQPHGTIHEFEVRVCRLIGVIFLAMIAVYYYFAGEVWIAAVAAVVMLIAGSSSRPFRGR